ncbi:MAG: HD domain-containing protein [Caulobacteraceae bacterium]
MSQSFIDDIFTAFDRYGDDSYGENVTQRQHALQSADLAQRDGASPSLVVAALLHDYGHFIDGSGDAAQTPVVDVQHEVSGAAALAAWFPAEVLAPIALHVAAKRYLCAVEPGYEAELSAASALSLSLQGGRFTPVECERFAQARGFADAIRLRRYDDLAKVPDAATLPLEAYRDLIAAVAKPGAGLPR